MGQRRAAAGLPERNWGRVARTLQEFIRSKTEELQRRGALVAVSGGLDSATVACLCARALGRESVLALVMPEGAGPDADDARRAASDLGLRTEVVDITPQLQALGAYDAPLYRLPPAMRNLVVKVAYRHLWARWGVSPFLRAAERPGAGIVARAAACFRARHRVRLVTAAFRAEQENLLLVGSANRTETLTGIFCKFGIDHCADIMPLAPLYRTEVLRLAAQIGVPDWLIRKAPDPGIVPGAEDKYRFFLGVSSTRLDGALAALAAGRPAEQVAETVGLPPRRVRELRRLMDATRHMRNPSLEPRLD